MGNSHGIYFTAGLDVDVSSRTSSTTREDDDYTTDGQSHRTPDSDTIHVTDNITITQPVYIDQ